MASEKALDLSLLQAQCKKNPKLKKLFELYKMREKGRNNCTVPRVRRIMKESGTDLSKEEAIEIMELWEKAGAGRFISGKRDQDNRFQWQWDIPSVAARVLAPPAPKGVQPAPIKPSPRARLKLPKLPAEAEVTKVLESEPSVGAKSIMIRIGEFELELPTDMTPEELEQAEKVIKRIQALKK